MSDIDEALAYFRRERKECEGKLHGHQLIPQFTEDMQKAVQHMDTAIAALERRRVPEGYALVPIELWWKLQASNWQTVHIGSMCKRLEVTYYQDQWETIMQKLAAAPVPEDSDAPKKGFDSETAPYSGGRG